MTLLLACAVLAGPVAAGIGYDASLIFADADDAL
jgi:hypothetical protein